MARTATPDMDGPHYPLSDALASGVPDAVLRDARAARRIYLTRPDASPVRFILGHARDRNGGTWTAKGHRNGKTLTGYAGGHAPRGDGTAGLSALGIARALAGMERQASGPVACCPSCGRRLPAGLPPEA